ncbi:MAG: alpha/beta fold hydrolase [Calditrichaeota bacterium]|nr:MAG: alpha/beta fold hydrolase [Calditrichota bacterium]
MNSNWRPLIFAAISFFPAFCFGQENEIQNYKDIYFEYQTVDSLQMSPLVICVPGFTQHNRSPEFQLLKSWLRSKGYSCLIMNPPQHGEIYHKSRIYTWGEREVDDLLALALEKLPVFENHREVHLLGFSIGAKIVLKFAAHEKIKSKIKSVIAIAAPFQVGAINAQSFGKGLEGLFSSSSARKRSSFMRMSYMVFPGMVRALLINKETPALEVPQIAAPVLLLHGANDWLTKSYHSKLLFERGRANQAISFIALNTRIHAEDMLTRGDSALQATFFEVISNWFDYNKKTNLDSAKTTFNNEFTNLVKRNENPDGIIFPVEKITQLSSPTLNNLNSNIWSTPASQNPAGFSLQGRISTNGDSRHFISMGATRSTSIFKYFQGGYAFAKNEGKDFSNHEAYFSLYYPVGSFLWMRKLTYIYGIEEKNRRSIVSADLAFLILDFQLNFGDIRSRDVHEWQINFNFPLISPADGLYFWGINYSRFFNSIPAANSFSTYFYFGPRLSRHRVQMFCEYQFLQPARNLSDSRWQVGVAMNFFEH